MRILGIETSGPTGSVALVEDGIVVAQRSHDERGAHAERLLPLIEAILRDSGWARNDVERVSVGLGPGSFTGLRVGIALAVGIAEGAGINAVGVGSLEALCADALGHGTRVGLLDARRDEIFAAAYDHDGSERLAPVALPRASALQTLRQRLEGDLLLCGAIADELGARELGFDVCHSPGTRHPTAATTARLGALLPPVAHLEPLYVRPADAIRPNLPPSPF